MESHPNTGYTRSHGAGGVAQWDSRENDKKGSVSERLGKASVLENTNICEGNGRQGALEGAPEEGRRERGSRRELWTCVDQGKEKVVGRMGCCSPGGMRRSHWIGREEIAGGTEEHCK